MLPDLYVIWHTQRQMVADIFAVYGRTAELTRTHMLYCLFRHAASQVLRDVAVRSGQRFIVQQLSSRALTTAASKIGVAVSKRVVGTATQPLDPARRRRGRLGLRVLGHAAGREDRAAAARVRDAAKDVDAAEQEA